VTYTLGARRKHNQTDSGTTRVEIRKLESNFATRCHSTSGNLPLRSIQTRWSGTEEHNKKCQT